MTCAKLSFLDPILDPIGGRRGRTGRDEMGRRPNALSVSRAISYFPGLYSTAQDGGAHIPKPGVAVCHIHCPQGGGKRRAAFVDSRKALLRSTVSHRHVCARK